ncbi:MAG TPA: substrate-binding domain-containing protein [Geothrix sp.]|nr:substrate-binding domain-containing protein [Geothrix sp.]
MRGVPMRRAKAWTSLLLGCACAFGWSQGTQAIRINGTGSGLTLLKPIAEAYRRAHPEVRIDLGKPLGSSGAIKALLAGALDVAISSKPITAEASAKGARLWAYGKTPLALVAEADVPVAGLTTHQLEDVLAGRMTRWPQGAPLRLVLRPEGDADTQILRAFSPAMNQAMSQAQARPGMLLAVTDPEATTLISRTQGACGVSGLASVLGDGFPLKVLSFNGVHPTPAALANGTYPLAKDLHVVITARTSEAALAFVDFLYSPQGRALAQTAGVWVTATAPPGR